MFKFITATIIATLFATVAHAETMSSIDAIVLMKGLDTAQSTTPSEVLTSIDALIVMGVVK